MSGRSSWVLSVDCLRILICADDILSSPSIAYTWMALYDWSPWPCWQTVGFSRNIYAGSGCLTDDVDHVDRLLVYNETFMLGQAVWPITLTMLIDCWFVTKRLCLIRMYDWSKTGPACNLHTRYIHTESHTWNTLTWTKKKHYGIHFTSVYIQNM